jgi:hypothetical protein
MAIARQIVENNWLGYKAQTRVTFFQNSLFGASIHPYTNYDKSTTYKADPFKK